jgi:hypothetical protein
MARPSHRHARPTVGRVVLASKVHRRPCVPQAQALDLSHGEFELLVLALTGIDSVRKVRMVATWTGERE